MIWGAPQRHTELEVTPAVAPSPVAFVAGWLCSVIFARPSSWITRHESYKTPTYRRIRFRARRMTSELGLERTCSAALESLGPCVVVGGCSRRVALGESTSQRQSPELTTHLVGQPSVQVFTRTQHADCVGQLRHHGFASVSLLVRGHNLVGHPATSGDMHSLVSCPAPHSNQIVVLAGPGSAPNTTDFPCGVDEWLEGCV